MTINVGIIEDEEVHATQLVAVLKTWEQLSANKVSYTIYVSDTDFFAKDFFQFDILFLDIRLKGANADGIQIAKKLRLMKYEGSIVFLTCYHEYVFDGYPVRALNYLLKPATLEKVKPCMDILMDSLSKASYVYRNRDVLIKIPYSKIFLFTTNKHYIEIVTKEKTYVQLETLSNISQYLPSNFKQCHRTTIANIDRIMQISNKNIVFPNNYMVPISRPYLAEIKKTFITLARGRKIV